MRYIRITKGFGQCVLLLPFSRLTKNDMSREIPISLEYTQAAPVHAIVTFEQKI